MNEMPNDFHDLIDDYLAGALDQPRLEHLEVLLRTDAAARDHFVRYCRLHTDLHLEMRAKKAGRRALHGLGKDTRAVFSPRKKLVFVGVALASAAVLLIVTGIWWWSYGQSGKSRALREEVAWLINAQDCLWADGQIPAGDMVAGKYLHLVRGLVEIRFQSGARVVLEGPASLELLSSNSARLVRGKLSAQVPPAAKGFQITSPQGKVVDLGTEFAMVVDGQGITDVYVFAGKVEASAAKKSPVVSVQEKQAARIDATGVALQPEEGNPHPPTFVRAIVPSPKIIPRQLTLDFRKPVPLTLADSAGSGTGLTHRLPGTGKKLLSLDRNLMLDNANGQLVLKTTNSDINTSYRLDSGEYLGVKLSDFGFTGKEDFSVTVVVPDIPELRRVGQFGLYAGLHSKKNIRGGMISTKEPSQYKQFLVVNRDGKDMQPHSVGVGFAGDDLRLTLRREGKQYALTVENQTTGSSTSITLRQPEYLEDERDIHVGFFGANTQSNEQRTLKLKEFKVTVNTVGQ